MPSVAPPVPERFDDMHPVWWVLYGLRCIVLVVFRGGIVLAVL